MLDNSTDAISNQVKRSWQKPELLNLKFSQCYEKAASGDGGQGESIG